METECGVQCAIRNRWQEWRKGPEIPKAWKQSWCWSEQKRRCVHSGHCNTIQFNSCLAFLLSPHGRKTQLLGERETAEMEERQDRERRWDVRGIGISKVEIVLVLGRGMQWNENRLGQNDKTLWSNSIQAIQFSLVYLI